MSCTILHETVSEIQLVLKNKSPEGLSHIAAEINGRDK